MLSRRHFCYAGAVAGLASAVEHAAAADRCAAMTRERQLAKAPDEALQALQAGNERFMTQNMRNCDLLAQVRATAGGQAPFAAVLGCIDSRVPPELVFDQRIGDIFSARIAGNFVNTDIIGSLEFATKLAGAKLIVVLGHSECGAIKGAIDRVRLGFLTQMLANVWPAVEATEGAPGDRTSKNKAFVQRVAETNARMAARLLTRQSSVVQDLIAQKQLKVVSAMHDIASGRVSYLA